MVQKENIYKSKIKKDNYDLEKILFKNDNNDIDNDTSSIYEY